MRGVERRSGAQDLPRMAEKVYVRHAHKQKFMYARHTSNMTARRWRLDLESEFAKWKRKYMNVAERTPR